jgi:glutathione synthase/RimK-type ligase-like ATP-grasp enzyme
MTTCSLLGRDLLVAVKAHAPQALEVARHLEEGGALIVNTWASTSSCPDRALMAQRADRDGERGPPGAA